jgi:hypothetical protein
VEAIMTDFELLSYHSRGGNLIILKSLSGDSTSPLIIRTTYLQNAIQKRYRNVNSLQTLVSVVVMFPILCRSQSSRLPETVESV